MQHTWTNTAGRRLGVVCRCGDLYPRPLYSSHTHIFPPLERPQGVPSVARAAAVTSIHDAAFLETLADAAVRAMPQLSAADICSVVESFSGGWQQE